MELHEIPHPDNFSFVTRVRGRAAAMHAETLSETLSCRLEDLGQDVFCLSLGAPGWRRRECLYPLFREFSPGGNYALEWGSEGALRLCHKSRAGSSGSPRRRSAGASSLLAGAAGRAVGKNGRAWIFCFGLEPGDRFFGLGEKWGPLEKSGSRCQFWNTDVWADYSGEKVWFAEVSSPYASIPYVILERRGTFVGLLVDSGARAFVDLGSRLSMGGAVGGETQSAAEFSFGAMDGKPIVYFLVGPTLRELTKKLQRLVGPTPRPPLWALGHQQSRWGYASARDLLALDREFSAYDIPNSGLWLDIDYMDRYRVFSMRPGAFAHKPLQRLEKKRRRIVPILDPGVLVEPGNEVYETGLGGEHFCLAPSGKPYTGIVWPGKTHFPDFSQNKTRAWWATWVASFKEHGFAGFWIDMNDPATGPIENDSMLFSGGKRDHAAFHNQYALGMAMATHAGLKKAAPRERPFVLSRSGSTGIQRFAAVWTGDNVSNFYHLARAIPISVNLALSGVPFNGADIPGFGGDVSEELAELFYQATFLFPFFRNHAVHGCRAQEPWALGRRTMKILRHYIRLRYRFLPYLYQRFVAHEKTGEPILSPLFLDTPSETPPREDQYMVGPALLLAPRIDQKPERRVWLPEGSWFSLRDGFWERGRRSVVVKAERGHTSAYVNGGSLLVLANERVLSPPDGGAPLEDGLLCDVELHVFLRTDQATTVEHTVDDGRTRDYLEGEESTFLFRVERKGRRFALECAVGARARSFRPLCFRVILHGAPQASSLWVQGIKAPLVPLRVRFTGDSFGALATSARDPFSVC